MPSSFALGLGWEFEGIRRDLCGERQDKEIRGGKVSNEDVKIWNAEFFGS